MVIDIDNGTVFNLCSEVNSWIDILVWCNEKQLSKAKQIAEQVLEDWHEDNESCAFGDYLSSKFELNGIEADIYWLQSSLDCI